VAQILENASINRWNPNVPYNDLPPLPPPVDLETKPVLKRCIRARAAIAQLDQLAELIPNETVLITSLPLLEAKASSEIENIVTTTDKLLEYQQDSEHADPMTKEALRYSEALKEGYDALSRFPLSPRTAEQVCTKIKGVEMNVRKIPGTTIAHKTTGKVIYTPPVGEDLLRNLLANWAKFLHETVEIDPLIRMAVAHYQFEAIHPFTDGNGRTGRILNNLFLIHEDLLALPILYLSRYFIRHRSEYYRLLRLVTSDQAWEKWILFVLEGVEETAMWTMQKIGAIRKLLNETAQTIRNKHPKIYSRELVDCIFTQPYCRIETLVKAGIGQRHTASRYLRTLVRDGILFERPVGREKLFINREFIRLLSRDQSN
jgi:Fic family protein